MTSNFDFYCLRTNKYYFLCLRTSKTLSLWDFDESKTHLFLSPFFYIISGLKVQFNAELWSFHPNFMFCRNLKKIRRIHHKKEHKSAWMQGKGQCRDIALVGFSVATFSVESLEIMAIS